ncbi:EamA family transporter [Stenotrophobium rhamnosiphilum]|uniref:4-amino-4-deoxy-L-arabinose transferase n=1 Tax=Stenotrophobium rhamnosiphilum TaxID=2029166 RepID=A0A2T5MDK9_9GAMM|nr:EamA family transporter [Stenotrophobium rhamnosiphilum]PTU30653.1 4-amino-4-deoxy-L-arabinose transferase [Stenotrophobium rhamnosiphilum]
MKALEFGLIVFGVMLNAAAQLLLKAGTRTIGQFEFSAANVWPIGWSMATNPHIVGGLSCYVVSVIVWIMALSRVEVSIAYPMLSLGYIVNAIFAWWLFGEAITVTRVVGMGIIIIGVYLVAKPT